MPDSERRPAIDFNTCYEGTPAWDIGRPQRPFEKLAADGAFRGRVLDAGCGTGEHALLTASLGLETTGIDCAQRAIEIAKRKVEERGLKVRFLVWDALNLPALSEQFDTVIDSGLFHVLSDEHRLTFVDNLKAVIPSGGRYFMMCFSDRQPGTRGPRRVSRQEIRDSFSSGWQIDSIEPVVLDTTYSQDGILAWLAAITRI